MEKVVDPFEKDTGVIKITFTDLPPISLNINEATENLDKRIIEEFKQFAFLKILSAADSLNEFSMSQAGFEVSKGELYDFETLVSGFESYLASMQELLNGANLLFNSE